MHTAILLTSVCALTGAAVQERSSARATPEPDALRAELEGALRTYFAADDAGGPGLQAALKLAKGHDELLVEILRSKSFVPAGGPVARRGVIDTQYRLRDLAPDAPATDNAALFFGPAKPTALQPLIVYVPDDVTTTGSQGELEREVGEHGRFVFLVPDDDRDNQWKPNLHEHRRHVGPLRDLLLGYAIDPDRVFFVGSGRGGHATWAVGLLYADRFAGISPCNGAPVCEGSYELSGGVFLENAVSLVVRAVYNTSFDHGLEGCRYAARKFKDWGYRFEGVEEPDMRVMRIDEAMAKLDGVARDPHPRSIVKRFNHLDAGEHFWLRALERAPREWDPTAKLTLRGTWPSEPLAQREMVWEEVQRQCARLDANIRDGRIRITAQGVGKLRVYFDPELVDYARKVNVTINGKAEPPFTPEKDMAVLLQHVHETGDTARLYWASRDFVIRH